MRLSVDWDLCIGSGSCAAAAVGAFELVPTARGPRIIFIDAAVDEGALIAAARACPTLAIRLTDAQRTVYPPPAPGRP